jgi:iron complex transport system substrate-binding protein
MTSRLPAALLTVLLLATGCGADEPDAGADTTSTDVAAAADAAAFPVTVTADNGEVALDAAPERIVSLSPSLTEMLFAIGAGEQVVAVDQYSDFPDGVPATDLSGFSPNIEAIGGYQPDLVLVARDRDGVVDALDGLGIPTLVLTSADSVDDVYGQIAALGDATGHPDQAADLVDEIGSDLDELAAAVPERDAPLRYYYELSDDLGSVTSDTFIGSLLDLAGLESIADGADPAAGGFPQLSNEFVIAADPDVIFLAHADDTGLDAGAVAGRPGWSELQAVRDGNVVVLDADISSRWGPRIVDLLRTVIDATAEGG